ncbi:MAG: polyamine aminopropyltransferase [Dehalococcoidia bacterium]|nr:polyamine aminopropyltransferase [Dehalococcoidia bacterium]
MYSPVFFENDPFSPIAYLYQVSEILHRCKSSYQEIMILNSPYFGKMLVLDGVVQLTEKDEFFYHEMLAHVVLHAHVHPKTVLIIGGGDGGTLREVLKHKQVEKAQVVEIDKEVIEVSKRFFPELSTGFTDERAELIEMDGVNYIKQTKCKYDAVIVDSTDPVGSAEGLFTEQFFSDILNILNNDGIFVIQTESLHFHRQFVIDTQIKLRGLFKIVGLYSVPVATYAGNWWTFSIASKKYSVKKPNRNKEVITRYYDEQVHKNAFLTDNLYLKLLNNTLDW